jgi:hypothetical protein
MESLDKVIKRVIGISENADKLTPMDKGECKLVAEEWAAIQVKNLTIPSVRQRSIEFAEWCVKENFTYYFNGKEWMWGHVRRQEYYTSEELYDKWETNVA